MTRKQYFLMQRYMFRLYRMMPRLNGIRKREFMSRTKSELRECLMEDDITNYETLVTAYGEPEARLEGFLKSLNPYERKRAIAFTKYVKTFVFAIIVAMTLFCGTVLWVMQDKYDRAEDKIVDDEIEVIEETDRYDKE